MQNSDNVRGDITPLPGRPLTQDERNEVVAKFLEVFRRNEPGGVPTHCPTNATFADARLADASVLESTFLMNRSPVLFMIEMERDVYEASMCDIRRFFDSMHPWEEYDYYVFDRTMEWCVSRTHHDLWVVVDPKGLISRGDVDS